MIDDLTFVATSDKGAVSARLQAPRDARVMLVFGHGAGAGYLHRHLQALADAFAAAGIATLRFNFPYREAGGSRTDSKGVCVETFANAVALARQRSPLPIMAGGHSFGGRMASHFVAETAPDVAGLVYCSFPLHPGGKPGTSRANHLSAISAPQLFLSGTRDALADLSLLRAVVAAQREATLHEIDTADHSFTILKRSRTSSEDVYDEVARITSAWIDNALSSI